MIFFFASPQTSSSVNTTSHEQNNCMRSPTWCLCLLIVAFCAAVYVRWAYCSLHITSSPAFIGACVRCFVAQVSCTQTFRVSLLPSPALLCWLMRCSPPVIYSCSRVHVAFTLRLRCVVSPAGPVLIRACAMTFLSCSLGFAHTYMSPFPRPVVLIAALFSRARVPVVLYLPPCLIRKVVACMRIKKGGR